ncbi:transient receptor potential cation channel subfamily V member 5 [Palaemon carinicauda]|uniref:transient receptor potential cation channel subfamily V member 5 n=1 Tax=Palaemon carinicauda TaxID=392227 RepID=UPI0035B647C5
MGNTESSVTSGVKAQANAVVEIYSLVDLNGGGELVDLMKKATKTKEYSELDETIKSKMPKYMYNAGEGKCMPIHHLVLRRNKERPPSKTITPPKNLPDDDTVAGKYIPGKMSPDRAADHQTYRFVCCDLKDLGAVGETVLHLCVLNATSVHNDLAKRLIKHFPNIINDIYLCDEYYGENVLHISIVNEDPAMVKFLLDQGANYHERCLGNFMCPEDQKTSRQDNLDHEWVDLCLATNYDGNINHLLIQELLTNTGSTKQGANPDMQDTNGNTVTHMMVIYDKMDMFDMCFEAGASISIRNRQGLIPMTLAAILAHRDIFFHILNIEREIYWQIGNITCAAYPLEDLDTINTETGETQTKSALNLIAYGNKEAHLDLMEGPIVDLLKTKWEAFVKNRFNHLFLVFLVYFLISMGAYVNRPVPCTLMKPTTSSTKADMTFASLGITCVNVTVTVVPNATLEDASVTTDPSEVLRNLGLGIDIPLNIASSSSSPIFTLPNVTVGPVEGGGLTVEYYHPLLGNDLVTSLPEDAVTVQYIVEGEEVSVTIGSSLNDFLTSTVTLDPLSGDGVSLPPLSLTCYNKTHDLKMTGQNTTFFITSVKLKDQSLVTTTLAPSTPKPVDTNSTDNETKVDPCLCHLWRAPKPKKGEMELAGMKESEIYFYIRIVCEGLTVIGSLAYLIGAANECRFQGAQMFVENLSTVPSRVLFLAACIMAQIMVGLRAFCMSEGEDLVAVLVMMCTGPYFLFFCRGFKTVGPMVTMIYTMLVGDLLRFVTIYFVFIMGFSQAYYVIFSSFQKGTSTCSSNPMPTAAESVMQMFIMSLGNFGDIYSALECTDHEVTGKVLFMIFMAIVALLLINLLIAMMGNTYERIAEMKNEWMRQWARIVLVVERGLSPEERLKHLRKYSQPMSDGRQALVLRLSQTDEEKEEMRDIMDMKRVHLKYVLRRKNRKNPFEDFDDPMPLHLLPEKHLLNNNNKIE